MNEVEFKGVLFGDSWEEIFDDFDRADQGSIKFVNNESIKIDIPFGNVTNNNPWDDSLKGVDRLYGYSREGKHIILEQVEVKSQHIHSKGGAWQELFASRLLYSDAPFPRDAGIQRIILKLRGFTEWLGKRPFTVEALIDDDGSQIAGMTAQYSQSDFEAEELVSNPRMRVTANHLFQLPGHVSYKELSMKHEAFLEIELFEETYLDEAIKEVIMPLQQFFSLAEGFHASIDNVSLLFDGCNRSVSFIQPFYCDESEIADGMIRAIPFGYPSIKDSIGQLLDAWLCMPDELKRGAELTTSLMTIHWVVPQDVFFLSCAQAFEALARCGRKTYELDEVSFQEKVGRILASIQDDEDREWIKEKLANSNDRSIRLLFKEMLKDLKPFTEVMLPNSAARGKFINSHCDLRNTYTHRREVSPSLPVLEELHIHSIGVLLLCYAEVFRQLGMEIQSFTDCLKKSRYRDFQMRAMKELYSK